MSVTVGDMVYWIRGSSEKLPQDLKKSEQQVKKYGDTVSDSLKTSLNFALGQVMAQGMQQLSDGLKRFTTDLVNTVTEYGDQMRDLQLVTGESVEDTSRLFAVMEDLGVPFEGLIGSFVQYSTFLKRTGSDLGINIEGIAELSRQYLSLPEGIERATFVMERLGDTGVKLLPLLEKGPQWIRDAAAAIDTAFTEDQLEALDEYKALTSELNRALRDAKIGIAEVLLPAMSDFTQWILDKGIPGLQDFVNWFSELPKPVQNTIMSVVGLITAVTALAPIFLAVSGLLKGLWSIMVPLSAAVKGFIGAEVLIFVKGLAIALGTTTGALLGLVAAVAALIATIFIFGPEAWANLKGIWKNIKIIISQLSDNIRKAAKQIGVNFIRGIGEGIRDAWSWLTGLIGQVTSVLSPRIGGSQFSSMAQGGTAVPIYSSVQPLSVSVGAIEVHGSLSDSERAWFDRRAENIAVTTLMEALA